MDTTNRTECIVIGALRDCIHRRMWSQRKASGELFSSRDGAGAATWHIMLSAAMESVWMSTGVERGVMATAAAMAIASILVERPPALR